MQLADPSELVHRPIPEHRLAVDQVLAHGTEVPAILRHGSMIAKHEIKVRRHNGLGIRTGIRVLHRDVFFVQGFAVYIDLPAVNANAVACNPDHALDVTLRRIAWIPEDDNVVAL